MTDNALTAENVVKEKSHIKTEKSVDEIAGSSSSSKKYRLEVYGMIIGGKFHSSEPEEIIGQFDCQSLLLEASSEDSKTKLTGALKKLEIKTEEEFKLSLESDSPHFLLTLSHEPLYSATRKVKPGVIEQEYKSKLIPEVVAKFDNIGMEERKETSGISTVMFRSIQPIEFGLAIKAKLNKSMMGLFFARFYFMGSIYIIYPDMPFELIPTKFSKKFMKLEPLYRIVPKKVGEATNFNKRMPEQMDQRSRLNEIEQLLANLNSNKSDNENVEQSYEVERSSERGANEKKPQKKKQTKKKKKTKTNN